MLLWNSVQFFVSGFSMFVSHSFRHLSTVYYAGPGHFAWTQLYQSHVDRCRWVSSLNVSCVSFNFCLNTIPRRNDKTYYCRQTAWHIHSTRHSGRYLRDDRHAREHEIEINRGFVRFTTQGKDHVSHYLVGTLQIWQVVSSVCPRLYCYSFRNLDTISMSLQPIVQFVLKLAKDDHDELCEMVRFSLDVILYHPRNKPGLSNLIKKLYFQIVKELESKMFRFLSLQMFMPGRKTRFEMHVVNWNDWKVFFHVEFLSKYLTV